MKRLTLDHYGGSIADILGSLIPVFYLQVLMSAMTLSSVAAIKTAQTPSPVSIVLVILVSSFCLTSGLVMILTNARRHLSSVVRSVRT